MQNKQGSKSRKLLNKQRKKDNSKEADEADIDISQLQKIEAIDVYLTDTKAINMGYRHAWHLKMINQKISSISQLEEIDESIKILNIKPVENQITEIEEIGQLKNSNLRTDQPLQSKSSGYMYTQDSNPSFYYSDYKMLIMLDFSKSTSSIYPFQTSSYIEKLRESLEIIVSNSIFKLEKKAEGTTTIRESGDSGPQSSLNALVTKKKLRNNTLRDDDENEEEKQNEETNKIDFSTIHEEITPKKQFNDDSYLENSQFGSNDVLLNIQQESSNSKMGRKYSHYVKESQNVQTNKAESSIQYEPQVFLTIMASGLPPENNIKLIIHNQKVDINSLNEVLKSIEFRLQGVEDQLAEHSGLNDKAPQKLGYLQHQLANAYHIFNLMKTDAKPLLVILTDSSSSLIAEPSFGQLNSVMQRLLGLDTKIFTIDLGDENKIGNSLGYINHDEHLKYLSQIGQGFHFNYEMIQKLGNLFGANSLNQTRPRIGSNSFYIGLGKESKQSKIQFGFNKTNTEYLNSMQDLRSQSSLKAFNSLLRGLSNNLDNRAMRTHDEDQRFINIFQKVIFSQHCNQGKQMRDFETSDSTQLIQHSAASTIFDNMIDFEKLKKEGANLSKSKKIKNYPVNPSFSVSQLIFNNSLIPIYRSEKLQQYNIKCSQIQRLCLFRSKSSFQLYKIKHLNQPIIPLKAKSADLNTKYCYQYWWNSSILIICSLQKVDKSKIFVKFKLIAQDEIIDSLKKDKKYYQQTNKKDINNNLFRQDISNNFYDKLCRCLKILKIQDKKYELFDQISLDIKQSFKVLNQLAIQSQEKFKGLDLFIKTKEVNASETPANRDPLKNEAFDTISTLNEYTSKSAPRGLRLTRHEKQLNEDQVKDLLISHQRKWRKINKIRTEMWPQHFQYLRLDIITQSNYKFMDLTTNQQIDGIAELDRAIKKNSFEKIRGLTTFTLNRNKFVQIFKNELTGKQKSFGFGLIQIEWAAANIAVCHFGFYDTSSDNICQFMTSFKSLMGKTDLSQNNLNFQCYSKKFSSLLMDLTFDEYDDFFNEEAHNYDSEENLEENFQEDDNKSVQSQNISQQMSSDNASTFVLNIDFEMLLFRDNQDYKIYNNKFRKQSNVCYHKSWIWINENKNTNEDFFASLMRQRINEGFYYVNFNQSSKHNKYMFVKLLPAYKQKIAKKLKKTGNKQKNSLDYQGDLGQHCSQEQVQNEQCHVLVQFIMYFDTEYERAHGKSCFKTDLYMDQETSYFYIQKHPEKLIGKDLGHFLYQSRSSFQLNNLESDNLENPIITNQSQYSCLPDKSFFFELQNYITSIDSFLLGNTCTYHNIVKNSVLKQINSPENQLIQHEVCYFKNLNVKMRKSRQRQQLEFAIRQKMTLLRKDWKEFLKQVYPELFTNEEEQEKIQSNKKDMIKKLIYEKQQSQKINAQQEVDKIVEDETFMLQIEELLENSKLIQVQHFIVPHFSEMKKGDSLREATVQFYEDLVKIFENFSDFRMVQYQKQNFIFYCKLVTKQILFLMKVPTKQEFLFQNKEKGYMEVEFYKFNRKMIKISKKFMNHSMLHFLNPQYQQDIQASYNEALNEKDKSEYFYEEEQDEENINQIDQLSDFIFYYENIMNNNKSQLQFEPNVKTIIENFCGYLQTNYDKVFAEAVIVCYQDDYYKNNDIQNLNNQSDNLKQTSDDFQKALKSMTECRFRMDISFLALLVSSVKKQFNDSDAVYMINQLNSSIDDVFNQIINRNFKPCPVDNNFLIFKNSNADEKLISEYGSPSQAQLKLIDQNNQDATQSKNVSKNFLYNLQGTSDSYSDSEDIGEKPQQNLDKLGAEEIYNSCQRLLFKVDQVFKNTKGDRILEKPLDKFSEIFTLNEDKIDQISSELVQKVEYIEEEKKIQEKNNLQFLMNEERAQSYMNRDQNNMEIQVMEETADDFQSSVEVYFSFFTIPQYVGLVKDQDVEFLCHEKDEILVNDDDHEDLVRVCKLIGALSKSDDTNDKLPNEDIRMNELYKAFNKKQVIKSIPYYFKAINNDEKDYKVYCYDEIQRKIIYGILRRTYALIAQYFMEHLSIVRPIDQLNIMLLQKYVGSLLNKQRQNMNLKILNERGKINKQVAHILSEDLKNSKILNLGNVKAFQNQKNEIFYAKSTIKLRNFYLKHQIESGDQIPFQYNEIQQLEDQSYTGKIVSLDNEGEPIQLQELYTQEEKENQESLNLQFQIPFWLLIQINETNDGVSLNIIYHLPGYKKHSFLNDKYVKEEINRTINIISKRVKVILLLKQLYETREMPSQLSLTSHVPVQTVFQISQQDQSSFSAASQTLISQGYYSKQTKEKENDNIIKDNEQVQQIGNQISKPNQSMQQMKNKQNQSRFKKHLNKYSKQSTTSKDEAINQSEGTSNTNIDIKEPVSNTQINPQFKLNKVYSHIFYLSHRLTVEDGIQAIRDKLADSMSIERYDNIFIINKDKNIHLIKISGQKVDPQLTQQQTMKSFSQTGLDFKFSPNQEDSAINNSYWARPYVNTNIQAASFTQNRGALGQNQFGNSIVMEIYGVNQPRASLIDYLIKTIEEQLMNNTIEKIAHYFIKKGMQMSTDDFNYIEKTDQKLIAVFPIDNKISDNYALLKYLKQNLNRFLFPIKIEPQSTFFQGSNMMGNREGSISAPYTEQTLTRLADLSSIDYLKSSDVNVNKEYSASQLNSNQKFEEEKSSYQNDNQQGLVIPYQELDFTLLLNFLRNSGKHRKTNKDNTQFYTMKDIFGTSLGLVNLSILDSFSEEFMKISDDLPADLNRNIMKEFQSDKDYSSILELVGCATKLEDEQLPNWYGLVASQDFNQSSTLDFVMPYVYSDFSNSDVFGGQKYQMQNKNLEQQKKKYELLNNSLNIPLPTKIDSINSNSWLKIKIDMLGAFNSEKFLKSLILSVNQAIQECMIEMHVKNSFIYPVISDKQTFSSLEENSIDNDFTSQLTDLKSALAGLDNLITKSQITQNPLITNMNKIIYGDSSDILSTIIFSTLCSFHYEFYKIINSEATNDFSFNKSSLSSSFKLQEPSLHSTLIIQLVNKSSDKIQKTIIIKCCCDISQSNNKIIFQAIKNNVKKTDTILRNIHPEFKFIVGSFPITKFIKTSQHVVLIDLTKESFSQFKQKIRHQSPEKGQIKDQNLLKLISHDPNLEGPLESLKIFKAQQQIQTQFPLTMEEYSLQAFVTQPRNFFIILSIQDLSLTLKTYNLDKKIYKQCKEIISNHLIWNSNRQDFLKRTVSQKLGTVYTLKDSQQGSNTTKSQLSRPIFNLKKPLLERQAIIIEGKQEYFKQNIKSTKKQKTSQFNKKLASSPQAYSPEKQKKNDKKIDAESFLLSIFINDSDLQYINKIGIHHQSQIISEIPSGLAINEKSVSPQYNLRDRKRGQPLVEKKFIEKKQQIQLNKKKTGQNIVKYEDFIQYKAIMSDIEKSVSWSELKLQEVFVVSPCLSPSLRSQIISEKVSLDKLSAKNAQVNLVSKHLNQNSSLRNYDLLNNSLYFHGTKVLGLIESQFEVIKQAKQLAETYLEWEKHNKDKQLYDKKTIKQEIFNKDENSIRRVKGGSLLEQLAGVVSKDASKHIRGVKHLLKQSRLLYSNTTMLLFNLSDPNNPINQENDQMSDISSDSEHKLKRSPTVYEKPQKRRQSTLHMLTDVQDQNNMPKSVKRGFQELMKLFYSAYQEFLSNKANVSFKLDEDPYGKSGSKKDKITNNSTMAAGIQFNIRSLNNLRRPSLMGMHQDDMKLGLNESKNNKKFSEDFNSQSSYSQITAHRENQSNQSMLSNFPKEDSLQFISRKCQERVLVPDIGSDSNQNKQTYIVKVMLEEALFIYELSFKGSIIRINVYSFEDLMKTIPRSIQLNYLLFFESLETKKKKRERIVAEEILLSTKLNTDSFNYDFHLKTICNHIEQSSLYTKDINLMYLLHHLLSFYKNPPKYAKNYIDAIVIRIDLEYLNKVTEDEFMQYYCSRAGKYGFKLLLSNSATPSNAQVTNLSNQQNPKNAFYLSREQGKLAKVFGSKYGLQSQAQQEKQNLTSTNSITSNQKQQQKQDLSYDPSVPIQIDNLNQQPYILASKANQLKQLRRLESVAEKDEEEYNMTFVYQNQNSALTSGLGTGQRNLEESKNGDNSKNQKHLAHQHILGQDKTKQPISQENLRGSVPNQIVTNSMSLNQNENQLGQKSIFENHKRLFYCQMRSNKLQKSVGKSQDVYRKIINLKCEKYERSDSLINADDNDKDQNTVVELLLHVIYLENEAPKNQEKKKNQEKNSERYPLREVSYDIKTFINDLQRTFSQVRQDFIKDQLWNKFFDNTKEFALVTTQITDMLRFSTVYDLKNADERYKELFSLRRYNKEFCNFFKQKFAGRCYSFRKNHQLMVNQMSNQIDLPDLLIYDPSKRHFLVHLEFQFQSNSVQINLVRKETIDQEQKRAPIYIGNLHSTGEDKAGSNTNMSQGSNQATSSRPTKSAVKVNLNEDEKLLVRQIVNTFTFIIWKRAV